MAWFGWLIDLNKTEKNILIKTNLEINKAYFQMFKVLNFVKIFKFILFYFVFIYYNGMVCVVN